jgi:hypothetical protein
LSTDLLYAHWKRGQALNNWAMTQQRQKFNLTDIKVIRFDLDDTFYSQNSALMENLIHRIHNFMHEELTFPPR